MTEYEILWQKILNKLEESFDAESFNDLFDGLSDKAMFYNNHIYVKAPNEFNKTRINNLHLKNINSLAKKINPEKNIDFIFITENDKLPKDFEKENSKVNQPLDYDLTNLNPNFTFNTFVVGDSNRFAYSTSWMISSKLGKLHNPLYIFGDVGLGKTHLMHAIGNYAVENNIESKILYAKADIFIEDYTNYLKNDKIEDFKRKYRNVDVLLIDDIQILAGAHKSQEEFFKIFDHLHNQDKQIVMTSDKSPDELKNFASRLTSRFSMGLQVKIDAPNREHRLDILKTKLKESFDPNKYENVPDDALNYIADKFTANIRELEGALNTAMTYCNVYNLTPSINSFKKALRALVNTREVSDKLNENNYDRVQSVVSSFYNISVDDLLSKKRTDKVAIPRHIAMYLIRTLYDVPYKKIGELFGGRDHSTVISACEKITSSIKHNNEMRLAISSLTKKINTRD